MAGKKRSVGEDEDQPQPQQQLVLKRTRDLPNLCDCHSCGVHVSNVGQDKLQTLPSQWRIVLLCTKCFHCVESAQICSYCYLDAASTATDCFRCPQCRRRVHRECVLQRRGVAPWSYACSGSDLSVCIDCWIPKGVVAGANGASRGWATNGRAGIFAGASCSVGDSRVSVLSDNGDGCLGLMEAAARDANSAAEKKIAAASRAREKALSKAIVARRAVELANSALKLVSGREATCGNAALNDAKLAAQLHRAMNSSVRISRNNCLKNPSLLLTYRRRKFRGKMGVRTNGKLQEDLDRTVFEGSAHDQVVDDTGTCKSDNDGKENNDSGDEQKTTLEGEGSCSNKLNALDVCDNNMESESSSSCQFKHTDDSAASMDERCSTHDRYLKKYTNKWPSLNGQLKYHEDSAASVDERCGMHDRYLRKYSRRPSNPSCHLERGEESAAMVDETCSMHDRYLIKYSKRSRGSSCELKHDEDCVDVVDENCRMHENCSMHDRYFKKYGKRSPSLKVVLPC